MREWESDPLFAAAEVVQDSADRMESLFRHLLHEENVQKDHPGTTKLTTSIECLRRDLATTLETAKWQLEDFEREVHFSAMSNNFPMKQNMIKRHKQFIAAIRGQINHVEQSMNAAAGGNSLRNMKFNDRDRDGLELFLSGGKPFKDTEESEDNDLLKRFLDSGVSTSQEDSDKKKASETVSLNVNEIAYSGHHLEIREESPMTQMVLEHSSCVQEAKFDRHGEEENWDLEANEPKVKGFTQKNNLGSFSRRMSIFGPLSIYGYWAGRSFAKRLKDGEEQMQSPSHGYVSPIVQRCFGQLRSACGCNFYSRCTQLSAHIIQSSAWIGDYREKLLRYLYRIQVRDHPLLLILVLLLTLFILGLSFV